MLLETGDAHGAAQQFSSILATLPRHRIEAERLVAWAKLSLGDFDAAHRKLQDLITAVPSNEITCRFELATNLAHLAHFAGDQAQAISLLERAEGIASVESLPSLSRRATVYRGQFLAWISNPGRFDAVAAALRAAEESSDSRDILVAQAAAVAAHAGIGRREDFGRLVAEANVTAARVKSPWRQLELQAAVVLDAFVRGDEEMKLTGTLRLAEISTTSSAFAFWSMVPSFWGEGDGGSRAGAGGASVPTGISSFAPVGWAGVYSDRVRAQNAVVS